MSFARWLNRRLVHTDAQGKTWPPGGGRIARWKQPDDTEVSIVAHGDAFDLYIGRTNIYNVTLTLDVACKLGWWIVRWWVIVMWWGIKARLWTWTLKRLLDERQVKRDQETPGSVGRPPWA